LWGPVETNSVLVPLLKRCVDVLSHEGNLHGAADERAMLGAGRGNNKRENRAAIRRRNCDPALIGTGMRIGYHIESKLIDLKPQASIVIANQNVALEHPQVWGMGIGANSVPVRSVQRG
jgi:hypothetical protein